jgi:hypothetical protein
VQVFDPRSLKRHDARRGDFVGMLQGVTVSLLSAEESSCGFRWTLVMPSLLTWV